VLKSRETNGFYLCQQKCALVIISEVGLLGAKPALVPMEQNHRMTLSTSTLLADLESYRRLIRRLIYLCFIRLELSYMFCLNSCNNQRRIVGTQQCELLVMFSCIMYSSWSSCVTIFDLLVYLTHFPVFIIIWLI